MREGDGRGRARWTSGNEHRGIECLVSKGSVQREREDGDSMCMCQPETRMESGKFRCVRER